MMMCSSPAMPTSTAGVAIVTHQGVGVEGIRDRALRSAMDLIGFAGSDGVGVRRLPSRRPVARVEGRLIYLSVSYSRHVLCTAASTSPIGIDIERIRPLHASERLFEILKRSLGGLCPASRTGEECSDRLILEAWTRYEASIKAVGCGTAITPGEMSACLNERVVFRKSELPLVVHTSGPKAALPTPDGYIMSITCRPGTTLSVLDAETDLTSTTL